MEIKKEIMNNVNHALEVLDKEGLIEYKEMLEKYNLNNLYRYYGVTGMSIIGLNEKKENIYLEQEVVNDVTSEINNRYKSIVDNTSSLIDVIKNYYKLDYMELSEEEFEEIEELKEIEEAIEDYEYCGFSIYLYISQVISKKDISYVRKIVDEDNYKNVEMLKDYIKKSETNGLIHIDGFKFEYIDCIKNIGRIKGIYDYNMFFNSLKKLGLNIILYKHYPCPYEYVYDPSYDEILECILKGMYCEIIIGDKRFTLNSEGYFEHPIFESGNQKVLK